MTVKLLCILDCLTLGTLYKLIFSQCRNVSFLPLLTYGINYNTIPTEMQNYILMLIWYRLFNCVPQFKPLYLPLQSLTTGLCSLISQTGRVNLTPVVHWAGPVDFQPAAVWCGFMVSQNICCIHNHNPKKAKEAGTAEKKTEHNYCKHSFM